MTADEAVGREEGGDEHPRISAEARDALYSQAMGLLSGFGVRQASVDPGFSDDLRELLDALGEIGQWRTVELAIPPDRLRRVISGIQAGLPEDPAAWRSARTGLVSQTCDRILAQLEEEGRSA
jgi:hypothetical protein